jgi:hypothetical protein
MRRQTEIVRLILFKFPFVSWEVLTYYMISWEWG